MDLVSFPPGDIGDRGSPFPGPKGPQLQHEAPQSDAQKSQGAVRASLPVLFEAPTVWGSVLRQLHPNTQEEVRAPTNTHQEDPQEADRE